MFELFKQHCHNSPTVRQKCDYRNFRSVCRVSGIALKIKTTAMLWRRLNQYRNAVCSTVSGSRSLSVQLDATNSKPIRQGELKPRAVVRLRASFSLPIKNILSPSRETRCNSLRTNLSETVRTGQWCNYYSSYNEEH